MFDGFGNSEIDLNKDTKWELVYTTNTEFDGGMYKANLEGAGIPVHMLSQIDSTRTFTVGALAVVKIFVPEEYVEDAKEIIKMMGESDE